MKQERLINILAEFRNADAIEWHDGTGYDNDYDSVRFHDSTGREITIVMDEQKIVSIYSLA